LLPWLRMLHRSCLPLSCKHCCHWQVGFQTPLFLWSSSNNDSLASGQISSVLSYFNPVVGWYHCQYWLTLTWLTACSILLAKCVTTIR
jgi:hypothetical protein